MGVGARAGPDGFTPGCDVVAALRSQIHQVHRLLDEQASAAVERTRAAPAARAEVLSLYVHALCVEDTTINVLVREKSPLFNSVWIGGRLQPWDLTTLRGYAEVVYTATDFLLSRLAPSDLRSSIDLSEVGLGRPDVNWVLNRFVLWETAMICGELATRRVARRRRTRLLHAAASHNGRLNGVSAGPHGETQAIEARTNSVHSRPRRDDKSS